jgi:hypothetical protein
MSIYELTRCRTVRDAVDEALAPRHSSVTGATPWADPHHDVRADFRRVIVEVTEASLPAAYEPDYRDMLYAETYRVAMAQMFRDLGWSE